MSKTNKISMAKEDPIEVMSDLHKNRQVGDDYPDYIGYSRETVRTLLKDNPDYQIGPVTKVKVDT